MNMPILWWNPWSDINEEYGVGGWVALEQLMLLDQCSDNNLGECYSNQWLDQGFDVWWSFIGQKLK